MEYHRAAHQLGKEDSQKLSEDMTERQQIQETNWMHPSFILEIFSDLDFQRRNICADIAMRDDDSLWLSSGAGGEYDFQRVGGSDFFGGIFRRRMCHQCAGQVIQCDG